MLPVPDASCVLPTFDVRDVISVSDETDTLTVAEATDVISNEDVAASLPLPERTVVWIETVPLPSLD